MGEGGSQTKTSVLFESLIVSKQGESVPDYYWRLCVGSQSTIKLNLGLGHDYTMGFTGSDSIQTCSFVSERFQSHTMKDHEFKESARQIASSKTSLIRCNLSADITITNGAAWSIEF